jgi:S1-C subfamily serine protease
MKKIIGIIFLTVLLSGCASQSQILVNPDTGKTMRCASSGWGLAGVAVSSMNQNNCVSDYKKIGFIEIEKIPTTGIAFTKKEESMLDKMNDPAIITSVHPKGPAYAAGIKSGDIVIARDGQKIQSIGDIVSNRDKYKIEDSVTYRIKRGNDELDFNLRFVPISAILAKE